MKIEHVKVMNFQGAFRGLRNPMNSWDKSDSMFNQIIHLGPKDLDLAQRMIKLGTPNDKFMRQILVSMDVTGPLYW